MGVSDKITYSDLLVMGYTEEDKRFELLDGDVYMVPGASYGHQKTLHNLDVLLDPVARRLKGELLPAPFDVVLSEVDYVQPDLVFVRPGRDVLTRLNLRGIPDLVIEILSHPHRERDLKVKRRRYQAHGVPEVWYVDPRRREVEVLGLYRKKYRSLGRFQGKDRILSRVLGRLPFATEKIFVGVGEYDGIAGEQN